MNFIITNEKDVQYLSNGILCKTGVNNREDNYTHFRYKTLSNTPLDIFGSRHPSRRLMPVYVRFCLVPNTVPVIIDRLFGANFNTVIKIILSDRYYLYDPRIIKKLNLVVNEKYIVSACILGDTKFLEWWKNSGLPLKYDREAFNQSVYYGNVNVLEWWFKSGLELKYSIDVLEYACNNNNIDVLIWLLKSNLMVSFKDFDYTLCYIPDNECRDWWRSSDLIF